jgi:hypothetical protein
MTGQLAGLRPPRKQPLRGLQRLCGGLSPSSAPGPATQVTPTASSMQCASHPSVPCALAAFARARSPPHTGTCIKSDGPGILRANGAPAPQQHVGQEARSEAAHHAPGPQTSSNWHPTAAGGALLLPRQARPARGKGTRPRPRARRRSGQAPVRAAARSGNHDIISAPKSRHNFSPEPCAGAWARRPVGAQAGLRTRPLTAVSQY